MQAASDKRGVQWIDPLDDDQVAAIAIKVSQPSFGSAIDTCAYDFDISLRLPPAPTFMAKVTDGLGMYWAADIYPDGPAVDGTTFSAQVRVWGVDDSPSVYVPIGEWIEVQRWPDQDMTGGYRYEHLWKTRSRLALVDQKPIPAADQLNPGTGNASLSDFDGTTLTFPVLDKRPTIFNWHFMPIAQNEVVELYGIKGYLFARYPVWPMAYATLDGTLATGTPSAPAQAPAHFLLWDAFKKQYIPNDKTLTIWNTVNLPGTLPSGFVVKVDRELGDWHLGAGSSGIASLATTGISGIPAKGAAPGAGGVTLQSLVNGQIINGITVTCYNGMSTAVGSNKTIVVVMDAKGNYWATAEDCT